MSELNKTLADIAKTNICDVCGGEGCIAELVPGYDGEPDVDLIACPECQRRAVLSEFRRLGMKASFHYADDSCKEWNQAASDEAAALRIFDAHPELEDKLREIGSGFLWSLNRKRPVAVVE